MLMRLFFWAIAIGLLHGIRDWMQERLSHARSP